MAGRRAGLAGERSGLFFDFARILYDFLPSGFLFENVPGLLSSHKGLDFAAVIEAFTGCYYRVPAEGWQDWGLAKGPLYGIAWRVLDAQWFGVPQRRRRVFVVGYLGDFRRAAEILFERDCLPWDSPPRRDSRTGVASTLRGRSAATRGVNPPGRGGEDDFNLVIADTITAGMAKGVSNNDGKKSSRPRNLVYQETGHEAWTEGMPHCSAHDGKEAQTLVCGSLDGNDGGADDNTAQAGQLVVGEIDGPTDAARTADLRRVRGDAGMGAQVPRQAGDGAGRADLPAVRVPVLPAGSSDDLRRTDGGTCGPLMSHSVRHGHAMSTQQAAEDNQLVAHALQLSDWAI